MKKVAVFTFCEWNSYGSILQAYGLKRALETLGFAETIYRTYRMPPPAGKKVKKNLKSVIRYILSLFSIRKLNRICRMNTAFIESQLDVVYYDGYEALKSDPPASDCYLAGSDQVWSPDPLHKDFFLDFDTCGKKRVSYAASFGSYAAGEENRRYIGKMLASFDAISVREDSAAAVIRSMDPALSALVHIDPTFLLEREEWRALSAPKEGVPERYILVYALYWDKQYNSELKRLSDTTGLPVVSIRLGVGSVRADHELYDCDVREFLWLIDHAAYVVTSSFHGLAFSLIFHKKFSAVPNPSSPARLHDLLALLGVDNCGIAALSTGFSLDYTAVDRRIAAERQRSTDYLRSVLSE